MEDNNGGVVKNIEEWKASFKISADSDMDRFISFQNRPRPK